MKLQLPANEEIPQGLLKNVAGVFGIRPIIRDQPLALRPRRHETGRPVPGVELVQGDQQSSVRVVAVADKAPDLLCFAALNGLKVKNYTEPQPKPVAPRPEEPQPEPPTIDLEL